MAVAAEAAARRPAGADCRAPLLYYNNSNDAGVPWAQWLICCGPSELGCRCQQARPTLVMPHNAAPVTVTAPVALWSVDTPPPVTSLADAHFSTGRPEAPESTPSEARRRRALCAS